MKLYTNLAFENDKPIFIISDVQCQGEYFTENALYITISYVFFNFNNQGVMEERPFCPSNRYPRNWIQFFPYGT
jgi:hypothetical protein